MKIPELITFTESKGIYGDIITNLFKQIDELKIYCANLKETQFPFVLIDNQKRNDVLSIKKKKNMTTFVPQDVMDEMLSGKIAYYSPGRKYSYDQFVKMYKLAHSWITSFQLKNHSILHKNRLSPFTMTDSWFNVLRHNHKEDESFLTNTKIFTNASATRNVFGGVAVNTTVPSEKNDKLAPNMAMSKGNGMNSGLTSSLVEMYVSPRILKHREENKHQYPYTKYPCLLGEVGNTNVNEGKTKEMKNVSDQCK